ncbi:hypothetical protein VTN96DRAFT_7938 [Rasamsonia emersonii]
MDLMRCLLQHSACMVRRPLSPRPIIAVAPVEPCHRIFAVLLRDLKSLLWMAVRNMHSQSGLWGVVCHQVGSLSAALQSPRAVVRSIFMRIPGAEP